MLLNIVFDEDVFYPCRTLRLTNVETEQCLHVFENGQNQVLSVLVRTWVVRYMLCHVSFYIIIRKHLENIFEQKTLSLFNINLHFSRVNFYQTAEKRWIRNKQEHIVFEINWLVYLTMR